MAKRNSWERLKTPSCEPIAGRSGMDWEADAHRCRLEDIFAGERAHRATFVAE
jgi:hypothetical protein